MWLMVISINSYFTNGSKNKYTKYLVNDNRSFSKFSIKSNVDSFLFFGGFVRVL